MLKIKQINNAKVKPIKLPHVDLCNIKGKDYFENLHPNILVLARKNSGKTTVLYNLLKNCANKKTKVYIFCSTVYNDPSYKKITEMLKRKDIEFSEYTEIKEGKINHLDNIVNELKEPAEEEEEIKEQPITLSESMFGFINVREEKKERKPKKIAPKYIFVFDDISEDLRNPSIAYLLKKNRHYGIMNIISTQSLKDITPSAWKQIDNALLFKNISDDDLQQIHEKLNLPTDYSTYLTAYDQATAGNYNFFYIDKNKVKYRQNFCNQFEI